MKLLWWIDLSERWWFNRRNPGKRTEPTCLGNTGTVWRRIFQAEICHYGKTLIICKHASLPLCGIFFFPFYFQFCRMNKIRVCIVEDVSDIREALGQIIELSDTCSLVGSYSNGEEALQQIPVIKPQVVLMDIGLGAYNGIDIEGIKTFTPRKYFLWCTHLWRRWKNIWCPESWCQRIHPEKSSRQNSLKPLMNPWMAVPYEQPDCT